MRALVGVWTVDAGLALGQLPGEGKTNEIRVLSRLLEFLDLKGLHRHRRRHGLAEGGHRECVEAGADHVFALKGNQGLLYAQAGEYLDGLIVKGWVSRLTGRARGRHEVRRVWAEDDLAWLAGRQEWKGGACGGDRRTGAHVERQNDHRAPLLHHQPGGLNGEDRILGAGALEGGELDAPGARRCLRRGPVPGAAANLSSKRRLAINLIKAEKQYGDWSVKKRRFAASQKPEYLMKLLSGKSDA